MLEANKVVLGQSANIDFNRTEGYTSKLEVILCRQSKWERYRKIDVGDLSW
ncbi:unnamed protein product [Brassica rapa subsp. trilocularis]